MRYFDVIIFIEHIVRELEAAVLMSEELKAKGLSVAIKSIFFDYYDVLKNYECNVLVVPWCYDDKDYRIFSYIKYKNILNLHHEQIDNLTVNKLLPKNKAQNTYHLSWGSTFTKELVGCGVKRDMIFQSGSARYDFYANRFKNFSLSKYDLAKKYGLNEEKKWILVAGNFPKIYFLDQFNKTHKYKISQIAVETYEMTLNWINDICDEINDEYEIIYRPHPTESESSQINAMKNNHRNFSFIRQDNIRDWILNSDIIFAWRSTSAIDSLFAGKKTFLIRPIFIEDEFELPILKEMVKINNFEMLREVILNTSKSEMSSNEILMYELHNRYDDNKGYSYKKLCDDIYKLSLVRTTKSPPNDIQKYRVRDLLYLKIKDLIKNKLEIFTQFGLLKEFENFKYERIKSEDIINILNRLNKLTVE